MAKNDETHPNAPAFGAGPGSFRSAAPLGMNPDLDRWARPGPLGMEGASASPVVYGDFAASLHSPRREEARQIALQTLRQGSRGADVQKLQRLLNVRLTPSQDLAVDGVFGPLTNQALLHFQKGVAIKVDGVVGKRTWYFLLRGDKASAPREAAVSKPVATAKPAAIPARPLVTAGVWEWSLADRFTEALRLTAPKLPASMRGEFEALLTPGSLGIMAGALVIWAGAHAFGVGEAADVVMLVGGVIFLGAAAFDAAGELADFLVVASTAKTQQDLDEAASHLAKAIAIIGVVAFFALLARFAKGRGRAKGVVEEKPPQTGQAKPSAKPKLAPEEGIPSPGRTKPTGQPGGKPTGKPKKILPQDDVPTQRSLARENDSAIKLADKGYKVEQLGEVKGQKSPDYLIEGKPFDCKAPETARPRNAASEIDQAVNVKKQADRIVLNLEDSPISPEAMKQQLTRYPIDNLKEVIAIKNGEIIPLWP